MVPRSVGVPTVAEGVAEVVVLSPITGDFHLLLDDAFRIEAGGPAVEADVTPGLVPV